MPTSKQLRPVEADYPLVGPAHRQFRQPIAASADVLFACLADGDAWKRWLGIDVEWTSPQPFGEGTTRTVRMRTARFLTVTIEEYFLRWEPGRRMTFRFDRTTLPVAAFAEDYLCEPAGDGACELVWSYAYEWTAPLPKVTGFVFDRVFAFNNRRALKKLARLIETEGDTWA